MEITPNKLTVGQLFQNNNEQFIIPSYQRRYAWGYNQYSALFNDIQMLRDDDRHLFGMLLFHTGFLTGGINKLEMVDGQQRITTLSILFLTIKKRYKELNRKEKVSDVEKKLYCIDEKEKRQNKIILGDLDNEDYCKLVKEKDMDTVVNKKLFNAYNDLYSLIKELDITELNKFYNKINNITVVLRLDVSEAKDAYKLFETINNRGLRLSPTDLIKNFILGHASKLNKEILEDIKKLWTNIIVNLDNIDTNTFFRQYMCGILRKKVSQNKLVEEFKKYYFKNIKDANLITEYQYFSEEEESEEEENNTKENNGLFEGKKVLSKSNELISLTLFLTKIKEASEIYKKIRFCSLEDKKANRSILNLQRIDALPSYIYLMNLLSRNLDKKEVRRILRLIEILMVRRHICKSRTGELDDLFSKLVDIKDENLYLSVSIYLKKHLPTDEEFFEKLQKFEFKGKLIDRIKYILEEIEYYIIENKNEFLINIGEDVHLEHIIPQEITTNKAKKKYGDWVNYLGKYSLSKHELYVNKIGNMTLLADELNIKASNNPFLSKRKQYKKSKIQLTQNLVKYPNFKFKRVEERSKELANIALKIWRF